MFPSSTVMMTGEKNLVTIKRRLGPSLYRIFSVVVIAGKKEQNLSNAVEKKEQNKNKKEQNLSSDFNR
jgi:hypothetical protein